MASRRPSPALAAWIALGRLAGPPLRLVLAWRARRGKEDPARIGERFGRASRPRPEGPLVWVHAASVGETGAVMPLVAAMTGRGIAVVFTSGTVTSAAVAAAQLPPGAFHQFAPLDIAPAVGRFLAHWRPEAALFVESELWPTMLAFAERAAIPRIVVNARLSPRSARGWARLPAAAAAVFGRITLCLAQSPGDAERFRRLGAPDVRVTGNLKADRPPLDADAARLAALAEAIGGRPRWLAASTHPGEDEIAVEAHARLAATRPGLLTLLVPRHPERGPAIAAMLAERGVAAALRSRGALPGPETAVYVADTIGELGLFYRLAPVAFVGGSITTGGGQNPLEPIALDAAVVSGPRVANFSDLYAALERDGGMLRAEDGAGLAAAVGALLDDPARSARQRRAASAVAAAQGGALARSLAALEPLLARMEGPT